MYFTNPQWIIGIAMDNNLGAACEVQIPKHVTCRKRG
jgi:hypothetical protein